MGEGTDRHSIPGTIIFDGTEAKKGYGLNKMCFSFNHEANRKAFLADEEGYCRRYGLSDEQREAIRRRDVLALLDLGGHPYYLAKFAGVFHLDVQDLGAMQTGLSKDAFKARLVEAGR